MGGQSAAKRREGACIAKKRLCPGVFECKLPYDLTPGPRPLP
jgi:hypothetical protein